jgi:hypothetical protein
MASKTNEVTSEAEVEQKTHVTDAKGTGLWQVLEKRSKRRMRLLD